MGFLKQELPAIDLAEWSKGSRAEKIRPMAQHWASVGRGTSGLVHLLYAVKVVLYVIGGLLFATATDGIDGILDFQSWWLEPIVFEKFALYSMLIEVIGLGCGFGPLNNRVYPPMGSILYWLRPRTIRLPPWPKWVVLTRGTNREPIDIVLYSALLAMLVVGLLSDGTGPVAALDSSVGLLPQWQIVAILVLLALVGLRDKTIFLAARGEVYGAFTLAFLFGGINIIIAAKLVCVVIWMSTAISKVNRHFPFIMCTMMANSPGTRPRSLKRKFFQHFPDDLRPSGLSRFMAHTSTGIELLTPLVLLFSHGGWLTTAAATVMIAFHLSILSSMPMGVPLEWNVFMAFSVAALFVGHTQVGLVDLTNPLPILLALVLIGAVSAGHLLPRKVSYLFGMRYYAGNWDTSMWCIKPSAEAKIAKNIVSIAAMPSAQLERLYGSKEAAQIPIYLGYAFRAFCTHGKALFALIHRAVAGHDEDLYSVTDGERICSMAIGWNFGDGHLHNEQLISALQERCHFEPGEVRVILLDARPIHRQRQQYRLVDAATGEFENGHVEVADMVVRQPWEDDLPIYVRETKSPENQPD